MRSRYFSVSDAGDLKENNNNNDNDNDNDGDDNNNNNNNNNTNVIGIVNSPVSN